MPKYVVDVKTFTEVIVEAANPSAARRIAEEFVARAPALDEHDVLAFNKERGTSDNRPILSVSGLDMGDPSWVELYDGDDDDDDDDDDGNSDEDSNGDVVNR